MGLFDRFRSRPAPIQWFGGDDPEMLRAIHEAQATYPDFVAAIVEDARREVPTFEDALVKYAFAGSKDGVEVEHMFLSDIAWRGNGLRGTVTSTPMHATGVQEGDRVVIDRDRVSDWLYVVDGKGVGGYTFRVMWSRFDEVERESYRNQPPFLWVVDMPSVQSPARQ